MLIGIFTNKCPNKTIKVCIKTPLYESYALHVILIILYFGCMYVSFFEKALHTICEDFKRLDKKHIPLSYCLMSIAGYVSLRIQTGASLLKHELLIFLEQLSPHQLVRWFTVTQYLV